MIRRHGLTLTVIVMLALETGGQSPGDLTVRIPNPCGATWPITEANDTVQQVLSGIDPTEPAAREMVSSWLRSPNLTAQALAVRALGRCERPELAPALATMLSSPSHLIRSEAATALGQAVQGASANDRARATGEAAALLRARLEREQDAAVRGVICETLGRLGYSDATGVQSIEKTLIDATWAGTGVEGSTSVDAPVATMLGAVKGLEAFLRQQAKLFTPAEATLARLRQLALARERPGAEDDAVVRVRRLALLALAPHAGADDQTLARALEDGQWEVRRISVRLAGAGLRSVKGASRDARLALIRRGLADPDWHVRYEAVSAFARSQDAPDRAPILRAMEDRTTHVALLAIDEVRRCRDANAPEIVNALRGLARTLPVPRATAAGKAPASAAWHRAAHAVVALAYVTPDAARAELGRFRSSSIWQARMYAARAAAVLRDGAILRELAADRDDNVRNAAISGLSQVEQHGADEVYIAQLARSDCQLLMTAARALRGSRDARAAPALMAALAAQTSLRRSTSRDARLALLERVGELGSAEQAAELEPLLKDFDPRVAEAAAAIVARWTGTPTASPGRRGPGGAVLSIAEVRRLDGAAAVVRMRGGGSFTLALRTWETPETVVGFVRLVECGYYNGLTFHRVEPNFVVQGGSPGANEYAGYQYYMRDEVGTASNLRGSVGLSTRGRNTGDAQWYINLADNARLDHNYTVFATVVSGMDVVDAILEGDTIADIRLVLPKSSRVD